MKISFEEFRKKSQAANEFLDYIIKDTDKKIYKEYIENNKIEFVNFKVNELFDKRNYIYKEIMACFEENPYISADGFINFRLVKYKNEIRKILNDLIFEPEYMNCIFLLKQILSNNRTMVKTLNILISNETYILYDEYRNELNSVCKKILDEEFFCDYKFDSEFLLNAIITLSPEQINIYNHREIENKNIFRIIKYLYNKEIDINDSYFIGKK